MHRLLWIPSKSRQLWSGTSGWMKADIRYFLLDETALQCFMVFTDHCRITTISQNHSLRFPSVRQAKWRALCASCSWWRSNRRACLCCCCAGTVLIHQDWRFWVNWRPLCARDCTYMLKAECVALFLFCPLFHQADHRERRYQGEM